MEQEPRGVLRRELLAAAAATAVAAPAAAQTQPPTPGLEFALEAVAELGAPLTPGATPYGRRNLIPITGGRFEGPRIRGKVIPGGGDWQLTRNDGTATLDADYMIQADDGTLIHVHNHGVLSGLGGDPSQVYLRTNPVFEAPIGPHDWLNKALFVGTVTPVGQPPTAVRVRVYRVT